MAVAKRTTTGAVAELNTLIPESVSLQIQIAELEAKLKGKKEAVRSIMEGAGLNRYAAADGAEALIVEAECLTWNVDRLEKVLDQEQFDSFCPRKPNGAELRKLLEFNQNLNATGVKELRACAKLRKQKKLNIRAAGQEQEAHTNELHEEAA